MKNNSANPGKVCVLLSGGIDSTACVSFYLGQHFSVRALFIDYGQLAANAEWEACQKVCDYLDLKAVRMDVKGFGQLIPSGLTNDSLEIAKEAFVPTRNLLFLVLGSAYGYVKSALVIALGLLSNPIFPDQTSDFVEESERTISKTLGLDVKILAPLLSLNKLDVLKLAHRYDFPMEYTYSCHSGDKRPCGHCISCKERIAAEKCLNDSNANS